MGVGGAEPRSTKEAAAPYKYSMNYFEKGGLPEYPNSPRRQLPEHIFRDILVRDIIARHGIQEKQGIQDLALYLM